MQDVKTPEIALELYLVRHGQSQGNAGYLEIEVSELEQNDPSLTTLGKKQAELLGERFENFPLDCILASPYRRSTATAYVVAKKQPENGFHKVELYPEFCECGLHSYRGRTLKEIQEEFPLTVPAPGVENTEYYMYAEKTKEDAERFARAERCIHYLLNRFRNGEKVLVAAHACFDTFLIFYALGLTESVNFDFANGNTGVTKLLFYKKGTGKYADTILVYHNDQSHLYRDFRDAKLDET